MILTFSRRYRYITVVLFFSLTYCWVYFSRAFDDPSHVSSNYSNPFGKTHGTEPDIFDIEPFDPEPLKSTCDNTKWTPGLIFTCDKSVGGIGNIHNSVLICVRFAIETGGALVMPRIVVRNPEDITEIRTSATTEMAYMFDTQHFVKSLQHACPQLQLYSDISQVNSSQTRQPEPLQIEDLFDPLPPGPKIWPDHPEEYRPKFYTWLQTQWPVEDQTLLAQKPAIIALQRSYLTFPKNYDSPAFVRNFGRILRFRNDARTLATRVLESLVKTHSLPPTLTHPTIASPIPSDGFFGAHLRTEKDAVETWTVTDPMWRYGRYDVQSVHYLAQAASTSLSHIYVASGNTSEIARFASDASSHQNYTFSVVTKFDLLEGQDLAMLNALVWDQQALVDFLVMLRASSFAGVGHSSFAWNIALKRHRLSSYEKYLEGPQQMNDEFSTIYGEVGGYPEYEACMWP
jgi:hypothetical protein